MARPAGDVWSRSHMSTPTDQTPLPPEPGTLPSPADPDPAPERDEPMPTSAGEQTELGQPIGPDNIREGRVTGVMGTPGGEGGGPGA